MSNRSSYFKNWYQQNKEELLSQRKLRRFKRCWLFVCKNCHTLTQRFSGSQKYCGSTREKKGCAYKKFNERRRKQWRKQYWKDTDKFRQLYWHRRYDIQGVFTKEQWAELKRIYEFTCSKCFKREPEILLTVDHKIPISKGGTNYIDNIQPLCRPCNSSKYDKVWFAAWPVDYLECHRLDKPKIMDC